jgi:dTDP-L-rhamnose 4-epimerase
VGDGFMTKVLVTGAFGLIGSFTVDLLVEKGYSVIGLDNLERQVHMGRMPSYKNERAEYVIGDIRHRRTWAKVLRGVEYVIHLAASVGMAQSFWQPRKYMEVNVTGTATMFETIVRDVEIRRNIRKIVVASSKSIYGEGSYRCKVHGVFHPPPRSVEQLRRKDWEVRCPVCGVESLPVGIREDKPPQNPTPYALSKYATEVLASIYSAVLGIPFVAFRYFNVYGPRQSLSNPYTGVIAIFLSRIKNNKPPIVYEDGKQMRDFVYVEDVARLNVEAIENEASGVFNLGTGEPHSLLEVIEMLKKIYGSDVEPYITQEYRPGDNRHDFADTTKLRRHFKNTSFTPLSKGLERLVEWAREVHAIDRVDRAERERVKFLGRFDS